MLRGANPKSTICQFAYYLSTALNNILKAHQGLNILTQPVTGHQADPKTGLLIFPAKQGDRHNWRTANQHRFLSTDVEKAISRIHIMPWQPITNTE